VSRMLRAHNAAVRGAPAVVAATAGRGALID
jgi:hypothetical protein